MQGSEFNTKTAMDEAREAWHQCLGKLYPMYPFHPEAFYRALQAYMNTVTAPQGINRLMPAPKAERPMERTTTEHFLALSSGHYRNYSMTPGKLDDVTRSVIVFCPEQDSKYLLPLFVSVNPEKELIIDMQGRKFNGE